MKIKFKQSGGHVRPLGVEVQIDGDDLSPAELKKLLTLIKKAKLDDAPDASSPKARDLRVIEISATLDDGTIKWKGDELSVPKSAQPLITYLRTHLK